MEKNQLTEDSPKEARFKVINIEEMEQIKIEQAHKNHEKRIQAQIDNQQEYLLK